MNALYRTAVGLAVALSAVILGLALSIPVDALLTQGRVASIANERVEAAQGHHIAAFLASPEGPGPHPAVIMIHEFWGLSEDIAGKAELLAQDGYLVVAPDTFRGRSSSWLPSAIYRSVMTPQSRVQSDLDAVFSWLSRRPDVDEARIAIAGFCYGGRVALEYSLHNRQLAATAVFYGRPITDIDALKTLPGPLLGIYGSEDRQIPVREVRAFDEALREAGVRRQVSLYQGQGHAFVSSAEAIHEGGAQARAWNELVGFLGRTVGVAE